MLGLAGTFTIILALAGPSADEAAVREILERERCQAELPLVQSQAPPSGARPAGRPQSEPGAGLAISLPPPGFMMIVVAVIVAVALGFLLWNMPARGLGTTADVNPGKPERERPARKATLDDAERFAREGRFGEAIHALLLSALGELGSSASSPAQTSREVVRSLKLAQEARAALGSLVSAVEWVHFGGKPAAVADYEACAAAYRRFRGAWRAGA